MNIAALSMALSQMNVRQEANISVMKKTMDQAELNGQSVVNMLQESNVSAMARSVNPHIGSQIDMKG